MLGLGVFASDTMMNAVVPMSVVDAKEVSLVDFVVPIAVTSETVRTATGAETSDIATLIFSKAFMMTVALLNNGFTVNAFRVTSFSETVKFTNVSFNFVSVLRTVTLYIPRVAETSRFFLEFPEVE